MKFLSGFLALFLCAALPLYAAGLDDLTWATTDGEVTLTDCDEAATGLLVIPSIIEGKSVVSIAPNAFYSCSSLTSITIPTSVSSIGNEAFYYCTGLKSITIPYGVTAIGDYTFRFCANLEDVTIPETVLSIGVRTFQDCVSLTSIILPDSVVWLGWGSFHGCSNLTSITIPDGVPSIGVNTFSDCNSLTSITIPTSVTDIGQWAFSGCSTLARITIPERVSTIGSNAFSDCSSLRTVTFLGAAPATGFNAQVFLGASNGAEALVADEYADSFGGFGSTWEGLAVVRTARSTLEGAVITGGGTIEGVGTFINGSIVTLTATPAAGQVFIAWTGDASGSENPLTLTVEGDMNIGAIFIEPAAHGLVTQASYDAVVTERDARFTEDQMRAMSADYTIGLNEAGNVQMKINLFESADLTTFAPLTLTPGSVSVVDGSICLEFARADNAAFYRFSVR